MSAEPDGRGGWRVHVAAFANKGQILFAGDFRRWTETWARGEGVRNLRLRGQEAPKAVAKAKAEAKERQS